MSRGVRPFPSRKVDPVSSVSGGAAGWGRSRTKLPQAEVGSFDPSQPQDILVERNGPAHVADWQADVMDNSRNWPRWSGLPAPLPFHFLPSPAFACRSGSGCSIRGPWRSRSPRRKTLVPTAQARNASLDIRPDALASPGSDRAMALIPIGPLINRAGDRRRTIPASACGSARSAAPPPAHPRSAPAAEGSWSCSQADPDGLPTASGPEDPRPSAGCTAKGGAVVRPACPWSRPIPG